MAAITATDVTAHGEISVTETTLGSSDTFTYTMKKSPVLVLRNATAGALTPKIDGDGGTTVDASGLGSVDVSGGYTLASIAAGEVVAIPLRSISDYLSGTITITGGSGIVATLLEF